MATYGQRFEESLGTASDFLAKARNAGLVDGDLMAADIQLTNAISYLQQAQSLIRLVSKTAFERVMNEKTKGL
jgi:hypothetical protein